MRTISRTVPAPTGLTGELVGAPEGSDLAFDLRLESVSEGVLVSGTAQVTLTGECARCLDPISQEMEVDVQQLYLYPGNEVPADDDEVGRLMESVDLDTGSEMTVDLERRIIVAPDGREVPFAFDDATRERILNGLDDIALTLEHEDAIAAYEATHLIA